MLSSVFMYIFSVEYFWLKTERKENYTFSPIDNPNGSKKKVSLCFYEPSRISNITCVWQSFLERPFFFFFHYLLIFLCHIFYFSLVEKPKVYGKCGKVKVVNFCYEARNFLFVRFVQYVKSFVGFFLTSGNSCFFLFSKSINCNFLFRSKHCSLNVTRLCGITKSQKQIIQIFLGLPQRRKKVVFGDLINFNEFNSKWEIIHGNFCQKCLSSYSILEMI